MAFIKLCLAVVFLALAGATPIVDNIQGTELSLEENIARFIQRQDFEFDLPIIGSVSLGARNLDNDEIDLKIKTSSGVQARKSKLKKIFAPILMVVILKAITLIPLALGVLGLKTWNALQLSFITFVISISLAVFQLCKKVGHDHQPVIAHSAAPWQAARSIKSDSGAQNLAYSAYRQ